MASHKELFLHFPPDLQKRQPNGENPILLTIKSDFKPKLVSPLGEGGQAKVFKGKFHGKEVAMKYIPLDKVKDEYQYDYESYGCEEFYDQEKFLKCNTVLGPNNGTVLFLGFKAK